VVEELEATKNNLNDERESAGALRSSLEALEAKLRTTGKEREELSVRIDEHADKTLYNFRVAIAASIAPILKDLPNDGDPRLTGIGPNLLIIIRQLMDALIEHGIQLTPNAGVR
jgi:hypothetical protein